MERVTARIESNGNGFYSIYVKEDLPYSIIGDGHSIEEAKENFLAVYEESRKDHKESTGEDVEFSFEFVLEVSAFLQRYKDLISLAGLSRIVGINKAQLSQYVCGTRHPLPKTEKKIIDSLLAFADEIKHSFA